MPRRRPARSAANPTRGYAAAAAGASTTATRRAKRTTGRTTSRGARRPLPASRRSSARRRGACRARPSRGPSTSAWAPGCVIGRAAGRTSAKRASGAEDAIYVLGATFLYGLRGRRLRPEAGLKLLRKLIEAGEEDGAEPSYFIGAANYAVAQARRQKFVTWPDKVAPLLRRAAACGLARAVHELGIMYEAGDEGPKDGKEAARLAALAADAGLRDAKRTLARMYVDGEGRRERRLPR